MWIQIEPLWAPLYVGQPRTSQKSIQVDNLSEVASLNKFIYLDQKKKKFIYQDVHMKKY